MTQIQTNSELNQVAEKFFQAAYEYQDALKKYAPKENGGVIWVRRGAEVIVYSHMERYTIQVASMTFDSAKDQLIFTEAIYPGEQELPATGEVSQ